MKQLAAAATSRAGLMAAASSEVRLSRQQQQVAAASGLPPSPVRQPQPGPPTHTLSLVSVGVDLMDHDVARMVRA